ncbi:Uroporphyrinogen decarboxylase [Gemmatirosa kalamazoonensis]|uniref:Uroporphyrinogen decarboxylase n=1 Tax=Gemmatirosa kalamazoonensis TaxID=861299 RepID=W0RNC0_9BACT|nr:uroporphyrinogen decarboxylase [Gemmatirosa kalamazoonensis]AHG91815.1 Uroporphyrinogen decarboxylase [Gemmatirosa kalamazoonensis]
MPDDRSPGAAGPFLRAARGLPTDHTPVWFMRQAGRTLPEYRKVRERWTLLEICRLPDVCAEVTLQPMRRMPLDAAVMFGDIMLPLAGVGVALDIVEKVGPVIEEPIRDLAGVARLRDLEPEQDVAPVLEAVRIVRRELESERAVLGFAGAPFTLASYLVEGKPTRDFARTKALMLGATDVWDALMSRLARIATQFLRANVAAGADAVQLFDSWVGALSVADYVRFVQPYTRRIFADLAGLGVPMVHFGTGTAHLLDAMATDGGTVMGLDWRVPLDDAWERVETAAGRPLGVQGNLDPAALFAPVDAVEREAEDVLRRAAGRPGHVFNLGHGLLPATPLSNIERVVDFVHEKSAELRGELRAETSAQAVAV